MKFWEIGRAHKNGHPSCGMLRTDGLVGSLHRGIISVASQHSSRSRSLRSFLGCRHCGRRGRLSADPLSRGMDGSGQEQGRSHCPMLTLGAWFVVALQSLYAGSCCCIVLRGNFHPRLGRDLWSVWFVCMCLAVRVGAESAVCVSVCI